MKYSLIILLVLVMATGCRKEESLSATFNGTWEKESFIGFPGQIDYPPGNGDTLILTRTTFIIKQNATVVQTGMYRLERRKDCSDDQSVLFFITDPSTDLSQHKISIREGKLVLGSSNCLADGGSVIYRRVEE